VAVSVTYPGVYVQEIPSAVHTIVGVPTSVAAFVGAADRGQTDEAWRVDSWTAYARHFGSLDRQYPMSWAVYLFFLNGGATAEVVRAGTGGASAAFELGVGYGLEASSPGPWGNRVRVGYDHQGVDPVRQFNLTVNEVAEDGQVLTTEVFRSLDASTFVKTVQRSTLVRPRSGEEAAARGVLPERLEEALQAQAEAAGVEGTAAAKVRADDARAAADKASTEAKASADAAKAAADKAKAAADKAKEAADKPADDPGKKAAEAASDAAEKDAAAAALASTAASQVAAEAVNKAAAAAIKASTAPGSGAVTVEVSPATAGTSPVVSWDAVGGTVARDAGGGIFALASVDIVNMLCVPTTPPGYTAEELSSAVGFCREHRAVLIADPPEAWTTPTELTYELITGPAAPVPSGRDASYAAVYYPNLTVTDRAGDFELGPCGAIAGVWAATDAARGVWKAPAGTQATVLGTKGFSRFVDDAKSGVLNRQGVNALRAKPLYGPVVWGARTAAGADENANEWKYLSVRRTALYIEESLRRATQWAVFEPNDEPLWSSLRLNVGVFMHSTWRAGAFQGTTPAEAYFVKCDKDVNPQAQVDLGIVNIVIGFAPLKPAEFVVISIQQLAGQLET
jgi:hypothetical protein